MKIFVFMMLISVAASAQSAKVVALSPEDTAQIKALYAAREEANKRLEDFRKKIQDKYISEDKEGYPLTGTIAISNCVISINGSGALSTSPCAENKAKQPEKKHFYRALKSDWYRGFELSSDFRYIVPAQEPAWHGNTIGNGCWPTTFQTQ